MARNGERLIGIAATRKRSSEAALHLPRKGKRAKHCVVPTAFPSGVGARRGCEMHSEMNPVRDSTNQGVKSSLDIFRSKLIE
eukprot:6212992-Pleurochrysis_carterae.AAC.6